MTSVAMLLHRSPVASLARTLGAVTLLLASACGPNPSETPEVTGEPKRGNELVFRIARHELRPDGSRSLSVVATHEGRPLGFDLELGAWHENPPGFVNMPTWDCKAYLHSQGAPSDELVRHMDGLYRTSLSPTRMVAAVELQGFSPWKDPGAPVEHAKFLLLFPTSLEFDRGGELHVEFDLEDMRLYVREKDPRLRLAVMKSLCAAP